MAFPPDGRPPLAARLKWGRLRAFRLAFAPAPARVTQVATEAFVEHDAPLRVTQAALEVHTEHAAPLRLTQVAVEVDEKLTPPLRVTQVALELFIIPPPCYNGAFPIDPV